MANHVSGYLSIRTISEEGQKVWDNIVSDLESKREENAYEIHLGHYLFEDLDKDWDFNKMCEGIGAKWAYATDWDESGMAMYSAWGPCIEFAASVAERIGEVDPSVAIVLTYEDEMPNFIGVSTFTKKGLDTNNDLDCDELFQICRDQDSELAALWDEDEEEWTDEDKAWEILPEIQWEVIQDWQSDNEEWSVV
jgi:hypothetical protein